jgi:hypothetical protein
MCAAEFVIQCVCVYLPQVGLIGEPVDLTYDYTHLGSAAKDIKAATKSDFVKAMKQAKRPMVVVGPGVLRRADAKAVMKDVFDLTTAAGASPRLFSGPLARLEAAGNRNTVLPHLRPSATVDCCESLCSVEYDAFESNL